MRIRRLATRLNQRDGRLATISRGGQSIQATVRLGRSGAGALNESDIRFEADSQDFFVIAEDYAPTGTPSDPQIHDTIEINLNGQDCVYELLPPSGSEQVCNTGGEANLLRIHTKLMERS